LQTGPAGRIACSVRRTGGRRSNRCSDWRVVTTTSVRAHSGRRPGAGHRARRPGARANHARLMRMLPSGYSPGSCEPAANTATRPRQNCLHAQRRPRRPHGGNLHTCRRQSFATAAFRRSPARLNHRHAPWKHSVARTLTPQRHASKSAARWCAANAVDRRSIPPFASVGRSADGLGEAADVSQTGRVDLGPRSRAEPTRVDCLPKQQFP
jgi:hypothetical protein